MSSSDMANNNTLPEELRQKRKDQQLITGCLKKDNREVRNEGHIDTIKASFSTGLLSINTY